MKHTPTPWKINALFNIAGANDRPVGTTGSNGLEGWYEENIDNAKFIVKAVNCHDDLVEAIKEIVGFCYPNGLFRGESNMAGIIDIACMAKEALEKADAI